MQRPVYKYLSPEGTLRFLRSWAFRITPPDQFNDPFEMRPMLSIDSNSLMEQAPIEARRQITEMIVKNFIPGGQENLTDADAALLKVLVSYLLKELSEDSERELIRTLVAKLPHLDQIELTAKQSQFHQAYLGALANAEAQIPQFMRQAESALHEIIPQHIGVLCLSGSVKHPLMWGHYADSHRGALLEFDAKAPCFNRRRHAKDEFGCLNRVRYSETRPTFDLSNSSDDAFASLALTKPLEWAYEQELRLLWPLGLADEEIKTELGPIHLIKIPPSAVMSITVGCKCSDAFLSEVTLQVSKVNAQSSIPIRRAVIDEKEFTLRYRSVE